MAQTQDYTPIIEGLTSADVNGIIVGITQVSASLPQINNLDATIAIIAAQMRTLAKTVPALSSLTDGSNANDIQTIDKKVGAKLSTMFINSISDIQYQLYTVTGVEQLVNSIVSNLGKLDILANTLAAPVNQDGSDRRADNALTSLDPKTSIDLYLTLYARKKNLEFLRDSYVNDLKRSIDNFNTNLRNANVGRGTV